MTFPCYRTTDQFHFCQQSQNFFKRILCNQLYEYFNSNNLLAEQQYGFRTNHSTEYAAVKLVDTISKEIESGSTPTALYIDLSKAFDTLSFDILLHNYVKLLRCKG